MKITGIIAEYNPFHNGHRYHVEMARKSTGAEYVVVVMSGNFVQRGAPAMTDKYSRARSALEGGADLVLELPAAFSTGSAEEFASCAIGLLNALGCVDSLCFGSECREIGKLKKAAALLVKEPEDFSRAIRHNMKRGITYAEAREQAFSSTFPDEDETILRTPNNILAIEYLKALMRQDSPILPVTVERVGNSYHNDSLEGGFCSAAAIRRAVMDSGVVSPDLKRKLAAYVPRSTLKTLEEGRPIFLNDLSAVLNQKLLESAYLNLPLDIYSGMSPEMAARLNSHLLNFGTFEDRIGQLKTRGYTFTRVSRALLHLVLGITKKDAAAYREAGYAPYARILGFRESSEPLLSKIKKSSSVPLIAKTADAGRIMSGVSLRMFRQDLYCSHVYQSVIQNKYKILPKNEFTQSVVII